MGSFNLIGRFTLTTLPKLAQSGVAPAGRRPRTLCCKGDINTYNTLATISIKTSVSVKVLFANYIEMNQVKM